MKVDFIILGAQKCGTTTLFNILANHPQLINSVPKEPGFFNFRNSEAKSVDYEQYHNLFKKKQGALYFEATTSYTFYALDDLNVYDNIFEYNPEMKFIYIVRNPIDRITSSYMHNYLRGYTDLGIEVEVYKDKRLIDATRYYTQISPFLRKFGRENVLLLEFGELISDMEKIIQKLSGFLDIDPDLFDENAFDMHKNKSVGQIKRDTKYDSPPLLYKVIRRLSPSTWMRISKNSDRKFTEKPSLSPLSKEMILNALELEVNAIGDLMNKDLSHWIDRDIIIHGKS